MNDDQINEFVKVQMISAGYSPAEHLEMFEKLVLSFKASVIEYERLEKEAENV